MKTLKPLRQHAHTGSSGFDFIRHDIEAWIVRMLAEHGKHVFEGITDFNSRKFRIRQAILDGSLADKIIGEKHGKPETFAQCFARFYGEKL